MAARGGSFGAQAPLGYDIAVAKGGSNGTAFHTRSGYLARNRDVSIGAQVGAWLATQTPRFPVESPILRMLMPLWGVAFLAGFVMTACHH